MDEVFIEHVWRSLKHEGIYLKGYADGCEARTKSQLHCLLQRASPSTGARLSQADRVWRAATGAPRLGHDGQSRRIAHMSTAATTADDSLCGMIVGEEPASN